VKRLAKTMPYRDFNELLLEAIDAALSCLGESAKNAIYFCLEEKFNLPKNEIPYRLEDFACALEETFKDGSKCLEVLFLKYLNGKLSAINVDDQKLIERLPFQEYVELIRQNFENKTV
jgi:hypothetical protein